MPLTRRSHWLAPAALASLIACGAPAFAQSAFGPFGAGLPDQSVPGLAMFPRAFAVAIALQTYFNERMTASVEALKHNGAAAWTLMAVAFAYGVVHAIGPGHGKAVVSSFVVANRQTLRRGVALAFLAAFAQAAGAVALIAVAAVILNLTSVTITVVTYRFEIGSDLLIIFLGLWMLYAKAIAPLAARLHRSACVGAPPLVRGRRTAGRFMAEETKPDSGPGPSQAVGQACDCGALRLPLAMAGGAPDWKVISSVAATTALRPCTGALIILVFARLEGVMPMGVAAVFVMGLGVAVTVAALAVCAAGLSGAANRFAGRRRSALGAIKMALEITASVFVLSVGALLLAANLTLG